MKTSHAVDRIYDFQAVNIPPREACTVSVVVDHIFRGERIVAYDENKKAAFDLNLTVAGEDLFAFFRKGVVYRERDGRIMMEGVGFLPSGLG